MVIKEVDKLLEIIKRPIYLGLVLTLEFIYVLIFFHFIEYTPSLVLYLNYFIQAFISMFLIIKFHPFRKHEIKEFDSTIIFGSALFILANIGVTEFIKSYFENTATNAAKTANKQVKKIEHTILETTILQDRD